MLRIWTREGRRFVEIPNGPFTITKDQLMTARSAFADELAVATALTGARVSPQTAARDILMRLAPQVPEFDRLLVGFAVTSKSIRVEEV